MNPIVFIVFFIFVLVFSCIIAIDSIVKNTKSQQGVNNHDAFLRKFTYLLPANSVEAIRLLTVNNVSDVPEYSFDSDNLVITFIFYDGKAEYKLTFTEKDDKIYLCVSMLSFYSTKNIVYILNTFFANKLGAKPFDYSVYRSLFADNG